MEGSDNRGRSRSPYSKHSGSSNHGSSKGSDSDRKRSSSKERRSESGERSKGGDRKRFPGQQTNSSDPRSVRCRVFVGNLGSVGKEEIIEHFEKFGAVSGVSIHANFGFIQYKDQESADLAVEKTHGSTVFGKRLDCNIASERRKPQGKDSDYDTKTRRHRSPESGRGRSRSPSNGSRYRRSPSPRSRYDELIRRDHSRTDERRVDPFDSRFMDDKRRRSPESSSFGRLGFSDNGRQGPLDSYSKHLQRNMRPPYDCEIVVMNKEVSGYGDLIESRLRSIGVASKLVLPQLDAPLSDVMDQVVQRGALYSVLVTETNELHRSCTLNILYGAPQEHRNMPLEDALALVARNFESYLRSLKESGSVHSYAQEPAFKTWLVQDPEIASLLKLAANGRILTVGEIDKLIDALRQYRSKLEGASSSGNGSTVDFHGNKEMHSPHTLGYSFSGGPPSHSSVSTNDSSKISYPYGQGNPYTFDRSAPSSSHSDLESSGRALLGVNSFSGATLR